ncbi:hypothetical protein BDZ45DRAFT_394454 [Acephala macrosclerotiorum]|nr:hypothetical protein BDZ45DRAFT_394454 [Acephala macrosclerotiorum]
MLDETQEVVFNVSFYLQYSIPKSRFLDTFTKRRGISPQPYIFISYKSTLVLLAFSRSLHISSFSDRFSFPAFTIYESYLDTFRDNDIMYDGMINAFSRAIDRLRKEKQAIV